MTKFILSLVVLVSIGSIAWAQGNVAAQCGGASGKALACCQKIVGANPNIGQCDKERAVFKCTGSKLYVSPHGCGTFKR